MSFIADLHIHSHYSIATSPQLSPEYLDYWARLKGIKVVGSGDFTHPAWVAELKEKLQPLGNGLFRLKEQYRLPISFLSEDKGQSLFMLTAEVSNIYKKYSKVRKVHNVLLAPSFESVEAIQRAFLSRGFNITSDGRPIIGFDSRDLVELVMEACADNFFIPAHIWTPWFSALGARSGFDSIEECYGDMASHIYAVETGLSTDPPMNWLVSSLDKYTLLSNSDAHSPEKLGRNANIFDTSLDYHSITAAMKSGSPDVFKGTIDFFPQEGKYHFAGHRKCQQCMNPVEVLEHEGICPVCGRPLTMGVMDRVAELADRSDPRQRPSLAPFESLIPLKELLSGIYHVGPASKKISSHYQRLIAQAGSEFAILREMDADSLKQLGNPLLAEAISRMRQRRVLITEGYDGAYGRIEVFKAGEAEQLQNKSSLFQPGSSIQLPPVQPLLSFDTAMLEKLKKEHSLRKNIAAESHPPYAKNASSGYKGLNEDQQAAASHLEGPALVTAGPGTGKTRVLATRVARMIEKHKIPPSSILAITFTNKAAREMKQRISVMTASEKPEVRVATFHALGYSIIKEALTEKEMPAIISDELRKEILKTLAEKNNANELSAILSSVKQLDKNFAELTEDELSLYNSYQRKLKDYDALDLDDLIYRCLELLTDDDKLLSRLHERYQYILVDEYQDINAAQHEMLKLLAGDAPANIFAIGDPRQSIYGFRGSDKRFIHSFGDSFPDATFFHLATSYRCPENILRASADVLQEGDKEVLQGLEKGLKVGISEQISEKSEAEFIARSIEAMIGGLRFFSMDSKVTDGNSEKTLESLSDCAILCRFARLMSPIEKALKDHGIPYQKAAEESLFSHPGVSMMMDVLTAMIHPENTFIRQKVRLASGKDSFKATDYLPLIDLNNSRECLDRLVPYFWKHSDEEDMAALEQLFDLSLKTPSVSELVFASRTGNAIEQHVDGLEKVSLISMHASKGLEFDCVFIPACEEGIIPYSLFPNQKSDVDEEARLLYVAMTRAKKQLWLSHARQRFLMGKTYQNLRSHFLNNIEKELLRKEQKTYKRKSKDRDQQLELF